MHVRKPAPTFPTKSESNVHRMKPSLFRHFPVLAVDKMLDPQHERKMDEVRGDGERMKRKGNEKAKKKNELWRECEELSDKTRKTTTTTNNEV